VEDHRIEVIDMDGHRIDKVTIIPPTGDGASIDVASEDS
jgi:CBS domain containing-hemolysin-like protein